MTKDIDMLQACSGRAKAGLAWVTPHRNADRRSPGRDSQAHGQGSATGSFSSLVAASSRGSLGAVFSQPPRSQSTT